MYNLEVSFSYDIVRGIVSILFENEFPLLFAKTKLYNTSSKI